ncbi:MAG: gliding motility-associated C-terminal domain-containing protein [Spirosomataceae bacterium]
MIVLRKHGGWILAWLWFVGQSWGQSCPPKPSANSASGKFSIDLGVRFCVGQTIKVTDLSGGSNMQYWYEYTGTTAPVTGGTTQTDWTYQKAGKFVVIQQGSLNGTGSYACLVIDVLPTPAPVFSLKSCQNRQVTLSIPANAANAYDEYEIDWGDGSAKQIIQTAPTNASHTYPDFSTRTVKVMGRYMPNNCGATAQQNISPSGQPAPTFGVIKLEVTAPDKVELSFDGIPNYDIEIFKRTGFTGTFQTTGLVNNATGSIKQTVSNVDTRGAVQCFQLAAINTCGTATNFPEPVCSVPFTVAAQASQNDINWTPYQSASFTQYVVLRGTTGLFTSTQATVSNYADKSAKCAQFCYRLQITTKNVESLSEQVCVGSSATSKPPAPTGLLGTITQNQVALSWKPTNAVPLPRYRLYRSDLPTSGFQAIVDTLASKYTDATINPSLQRYCYQVSYQDGCGNESSPSEAVCPMFLMQQGDALVWTPYVRFLAGEPVYIVEKVDANGVLISTFPAGNSLTYTPSLQPGETAYFRIRARAIDGQESYSNIVIFGESIQLFVPNAFSPNADGLNDTFEPKGTFISFKMLIYSRWGEVLYESDDRNKGWDGQFNGNPVPEGAYVYRIEVTGADSKTHVRTGTLTLVR